MPGFMSFFVYQGSFAKKECLDNALSFFLRVCNRKDSL